MRVNGEFEIKPWVIFAVALTVMFFRMPDRFIDGFLWAEDGPRMIQEVADLGRRSFFATHPGYAVLVPKLVAYVSLKAFPFEWIPWVYVIASAVLWALSLTYTFTVARRIKPSLGGSIAAAALALFPVIAPQSGEIYLNLTNLQWVILPAIVASLWSAFSGATIRHPWWLLTLLFMLTCTGPFGLLLAPFAALMALRLGRGLFERERVIAGVGYIIPVVFQALTMLRFKGASSGFSGMHWADDLATHVMADHFVTAEVVRMVGGAQVWGWVLAGIVLLTCLASRLRWHALGLIVFAMISWLLAVAKVNLPDMHMSYSGDGSRYLYAPCIALFYALVLTFLVTPLRSARISSGILATAMFFTGLTTFAIDPLPERWSYSSTPTTGTLTIPPHVPNGVTPWAATLTR